MSSTAEQRKVWREAKKKERKPNGARKDAIVYLRHAERAITRELKARKRGGLPRSHLLTLLALDALTGGAP